MPQIHSTRLMPNLPDHRWPPRPREARCETARRSRSRLFAAFIALAAVVRANVELASPFTSHAVLQCDLPVPIWGTAAPGERITVVFGGQTQAVTANEEGEWKATLAPLAASSEGRPLIVRTSAMEEPAVQLNDIVVGEVWLTYLDAPEPGRLIPTGASVAPKTTPEPVRSSLIRRLQVEPARAAEPQSRLDAGWTAITPNEREELSPSAQFARELHQTLAVPIGIIAITTVPSAPQAWISRDTIAAEPRLQPLLDEFEAKVKAYSPPTEEQMKQWQKSAEKKKPPSKSKNTKRGAPIRRLSADPVQDVRNPTLFYNGTIAPFIPYAIRGAAWQQGETTAGPRELYPVWCEKLIADVQLRWRRDQPADTSVPWFLIAQLGAAYRDANPAELRKWQGEAANRPGAAMIVTLDLGEMMSPDANAAHELGGRLSRLALAKAYHRALESSGPTLEAIQSFGGSVRLQFTHAGKGLSDRGFPLTAFEVADADGRFLPATAQIDGNWVYLSADKVAVPRTVRYACGRAPMGLLYNSDGLPAAPFEAAIAP
jgi:sialate O-acetylesterase